METEMRNYSIQTLDSIDINIESEVGVLKSVILKRPSGELENLTPKSLGQLLFDDIPFLDRAQIEHDYFSRLLSEQGVRVIYLDELFSDILLSNDIKLKVAQDVILTLGYQEEYIRTALLEYLLSKSPKEFCACLMAGVRKNELNINPKILGGDFSKKSHFWISPLPNLYFTRDPASVLSKLININHMHYGARKRESLFVENIFKFHPLFKANTIIDKSQYNNSLEGGDIMVLTSSILAVGVSERTSIQAVYDLSIKLFFNGEFKKHHGFSKVLMFDIPKRRSFMHLDTILTQVDTHKFLGHVEALDETRIYKVVPDLFNKLKITELSGSIMDILSKELEQDVSLINCGGDDPIHGSREQWSDGANSFVIRPGEVCVYGRNKITNKILEDSGVKVHIIPCSELSRGRGGPRCMTMPLQRKNITF